MSVSSYSAGLLVDRSVPVGYVAIAVGTVVMIPALLWARVLRHPPRSAFPD